MAGASLEMTVDSSAARHAVEMLFARSLNLTHPFQEIGASLLTSTQQRVGDEVTPEGDRFAPLAESTQRRRVGRGRRAPERGGDHILRVKGLLLGSITYLASPVDLTLGSNRKQAALQQLGGTADMAPGPAAVVARPYLGLSDADEREATHILYDHLGAAVP